MATSKSIDGLVNDDLVSYYDEKSKSGKIGLIITEHAYVSMDGKASENQVSISRDEDVEGLSRIVDVIQKTVLGYLPKSTMLVMQQRPRLQVAMLYQLRPLKWM